MRFSRALFRHAIGEPDAGGFEKAEERRSLASHLPIHSADVKFQQQFEVVFSILVRTAHAFFGERQVDDQAGLRIRLPDQPYLALEPELSMLLRTVVGEKQERRILHFREVLTENRQQPGKF